jgi:predicted O-linked N-acetylglucosamine transferase (SPINDLY family)
VGKIAIQNQLAHLFRQGVALHQQGRMSEAEALYVRVVDMQPNHFDALHNLGVLKAQQEKNREAERFISAALRLRPQSSEALSSLGNVLSAAKRYEEAIAAFNKALASNPRHVGALLNRGNAQSGAKRYQEALASYDQALSLMPGNAAVHHNRGGILRELGRNQEALESIERALALAPGFAVAHNSRAMALIDLGDFGEALASSRKAIALKPDYADAYRTIGKALLGLHRHEAALASYQNALAIKPDLAEAWVGAGIALFELRRYDEALAAYRKALAIDAELAEAWLGVGSVFFKLKRYEQALPAFERALATKPDLEYARSIRLFASMQICDWRGLDSECRQLLSAVRNGQSAAFPFVMNITGTPADQLGAATLYITKWHPPARDPLWWGEKYSHDRIRLAYLSADFHDHATAYLMAGLFEQHDRSRFEITAFSFGPAVESEMRSRLQRSFERFVDVQAQRENEIAASIHGQQIDIAVDLKGFTRSARTHIFALRPAPIQVSYMGYPGTMGADYIDYIIADRFVIPEDHRQWYSEKIVYLPDSYQANDSKRRIADCAPTRAEAHLPQTGFVFCSFNGVYKITPELFSIWMRLLREIDGSVLWLIEENATAVNNLKREATQRGISPERLVFAPKIDNAAHLARYRLADLFLDSLPCNAHTTASDALWAGLPVLTCLGSTFAGRVAASLLSAVGLPELITSSPDEYEALALKLARERAFLASVREKLKKNRLTYPLFDTQRYTRHIEAAFATMWEIHERGEPPCSFAVDEIA